MKKRLISLFMAVCLVTLCVPQSAFAAENNATINNIDAIYAKAYDEAIVSTPKTIDSDEEAYAYILSHIDCVRQENNGTISVSAQNLLLTEQEKDIVLSFVEKLNKLVLHDAVTVDENMQLHFVFNPLDTRISTRAPIANIMTEARNHANELKEVFDNAVFATKHYTAGMYFAERVKTGGIWDYKSYMGTHTIYYMEDLNTNMTGETIGNFHYGYVGRAVFEAFTLRSAAGMYQIISGTSSLGYWDTFFDDPADQHDINWGIRKYESEH